LVKFTDIISNGFKKATTILADASSFVYNEIEATGSLLLGNTKNRFQLDQNTGDHLAHNLDYIIEDDMCKITSSSNMLFTDEQQCEALSDSWTQEESFADESHHSETLNPFKQSGKKTTEFDYDQLEIQFLNKDHKLMNLKLDQSFDTLVELINKNPSAAARFWISLERLRHDEAIQLVDGAVPAKSKNGRTIKKRLSDAQRITLFLNTPALFMGKILSDLSVDTNGSQIINHWGLFEVKHPYIGKKIFNEAQIQKAALPIIYFQFLMFGLIEQPKHTITDKNRFETELQNRFFNTVWPILQTMSDEQIINLLLPDPQALIYQIGKDHDACFGELLAQGVCDADQYINVEGMLGFLCYGFHSTGRSPVVLSIMERQFELDKDDGRCFNQLLKDFYLQISSENEADETMHKLLHAFSQDMIDLVDFEFSKKFFLTQDLNINADQANLFLGN